MGLPLCRDTALPTPLEQVATRIGFDRPKIARLTLARGQAFGIAGRDRQGTPYDFKFTILGIDVQRLILKVDGTHGSNTMEDCIFDFPLLPNRPMQLAELIPFSGFPTNLYLARITETPSAPPPIAGGAIDFALGDVRDTEPPPRKPPPSR